MAVNATHPDLASQARHELVTRVETFASRNVVDAAAVEWSRARDVLAGEPQVLGADGVRAGRTTEAAMSEEGPWAGVALMTTEEWVRRELAKSGVEVAQEAATAGPSPVVARPRAIKNPFKRGSWNVTEQMRIMRRDPGLAERLRDEAD